MYTCIPEVKSKTLKVWSLPHDTNLLPSGLKLAAYTVSLCPVIIKNCTTFMGYYTCSGNIVTTNNLFLSIHKFDFWPKIQSPPYFETSGRYCRSLVTHFLLSNLNDCLTASIFPKQESLSSQGFFQFGRRLKSMDPCLESMDDITRALHFSTATSTEWCAPNYVGTVMQKDRPDSQ